MAFDKIFIGRYEPAERIDLSDHLLIDLQLKLLPTNIYAFTLSLKDVVTEKTNKLDSLGYYFEADQIHVFFKDITIGPITLKGTFQILDIESSHSRIVTFQGTLHFFLRTIAVAFYWKS